MDRDELFINMAKSFVNKDLEKVSVTISRNDKNHAGVTFHMDNSDVILENRTMICQNDIEVFIDLIYETIRVSNINRSGWIEYNEKGYESQNIWEDTVADYYTVVRDINGTRLQCESYKCKTLNTSQDSSTGTKGHSYYDDEKIGKTIIDVVDEYSIIDGFPVSKAVKSIKKAYYNIKK